jgi:hypothetical protein
MSGPVVDDDFWKPSEYAAREYTGEPPTDAEVAEVEQRLGYKLPRAYLDLARKQNGGMPRRTYHRTATATSWAEDHVALTGIYSIGGSRPCSLLGKFGSRFWIDHWSYPPIGVYFADCPSAGHDMFCLDYRACGPSGEPSVVHIDQEAGYRITFVAPSFEAFISGLEDDDAFE